MTREPWVPRRLVTGILVAVVLIGPAIAAEDQGDAAAQANNPLANMTALNFRNYLIGRITDTDEDGNQFWLRFVKCAWPRILVYNFENDAYSIPLGIGIGIGIGIAVGQARQDRLQQLRRAPSVGGLPWAGSARLAGLRRVQHAVPSVARTASTKSSGIFFSRGVD